MRPLRKRRLFRLNLRTLRDRRHKSATLATHPPARSRLPSQKLYAGPCCCGTIPYLPGDLQHSISHNTFAVMTMGKRKAVAKSRVSTKVAIIVGGVPLSLIVLWILTATLGKKQIVDSLERSNDAGFSRNDIHDCHVWPLIVQVDYTGSTWSANRHGILSETVGGRYKITWLWFFGWTHIISRETYWITNRYRTSSRFACSKWLMSL